MSRPRGNLAGDGGVAGRPLCHRCGEFRHLGRDCFHNTRRRRSCCCFCRESTHSSLDCQRIRLIKSLLKEPEDNRSSGGSGDGSINHDTETRNTGSEAAVVVDISSSSSSDDDEEEDEGKLMVGKNNTDSLDVKGRVEEEKSRDAKGKEIEEKRVEGESLRNWNHNNGGSCKHDTHMGSGGPIVIEISSSSSGEEDDDDDDVNNGDSNKVEEEGWFSNKKHTAFLSMTLRAKKESKKVEEEDNECVVLDFDPFQSPTLDFKSKISLSDHDDEDVSITTERGQVACRNYPHSRQHCAEYPFSKTVHENCCPQCHCYVCDVVAPCEHWKGNTGHCHASDHDGMWKAARMFAKFDLHISGPD